MLGITPGDLPGKVGLAHLPWADEQDHFFGKVPLDEIVLESFHVTILQSNAKKSSLSGMFAQNSLCSIKGSTLDSFCDAVKKDYVQTAENRLSGCLKTVISFMRKRW